MHTRRMTAAALTSISLAAAGLSLGTGTAQAIPSQPHEWCPGMSMHNPPGPGANYVWDMNVCHTWQYVKSGMGNVPWIYRKGPNPADGFEIRHDSDLWEGPNIPPGAAKECTGMFAGIPIPC
jgi:hypothetical protein